MKTIIMFSMVIGSYAGSFIPLIWGGSALSVSSIMFGGVGGFLGIWAGYHLARRLGLE